MPSKKFIILEDTEERITEMQKCISGLPESPEIIYFNNAPEMNKWIINNHPSISLMSLDHDLGCNWKLDDGSEFDPGTGRDVVTQLEGLQPAFPVIIHSSNYEAVNGMIFALEELNWHCERIIPSNGMEWIPRDWFPVIKKHFSAIK